MRIFKLVRHFAGLQSLIYTLNQAMMKIYTLNQAMIKIYTLNQAMIKYTLSTRQFLKIYYDDDDIHSQPGNGD